MSLIKHFRDEYPADGYSDPSLTQKREDKAKLIRLIHSYKTAKPHRARALLVSINRIIEKYMGT